MSAITTWKLARRSLGLCAVLAAIFATVPAGASAATDCSTPPLVTQPFLSWKDTNWYAMVPGQTPGNFDGTGWTLSSGARIMTSTMYDGKAGQVLDLGKTGTAVSPPMCVNNLYPYMRTMVAGRDGGKANVSVAYQYANGTWTVPKGTGSFSNTKLGWVLSPQVGLVKGPLSGWVVAQITLQATGTKTTSDTAIYNFYADPRMKR